MEADKEIYRLFNDTIEKYDVMIRRICRTYSTHNASQEDLYQEAMVALWMGLKSFKGKSALSTWIYRVVINTCISFLRRNDFKTLYRETSSLNELTDIAENAERFGKDEYECLTYLISRLSPIDKALILMWLDERSYKEISDVTGLSTNLIGTRLTRIRVKLRQIWQTEITENY